MKEDHLSCGRNSYVYNCDDLVAYFLGTWFGQT